MEALAVKIFLILIMGVVFNSAKVSGSMYCYECNSYMGHDCKDYVDNSQGTVYKTKCYSKCFLHYGEEGNDVLYRGCFDYYQEVSSLTYNYVGCKNQTWNGQQIKWCLCDKDLCNGESMSSMSKAKLTYDKIAYDDVSHRVDSREVVSTDTKIVPNTYKASQDSSAQGYIDLDSDSLKYFGEYPYYAEGAYKASEPLNAYKAVDQVHYGRSDDIYVQGELEDYTNKQESTTYASTDDVYEVPSDVYTPNNDVYTDSSNVNTHNDKNIYADKLVPEPYYPYGEEEVVETYTPADVQVSTTQHKDYIPKLPEGKVYCTRTGYFQNPEDCNAFVACIMDPHIGKPVLYPMRCPEGLDWDNDLHICRHQSPTCGRPVVNNYEEVQDPYTYSTTPGDSYL